MTYSKVWLILVAITLLLRRSMAETYTEKAVDYFKIDDHCFGRDRTWECFAPGDCVGNYPETQLKEYPSTVTDDLKNCRLLVAIQNQGGATDAVWRVIIQLRGTTVSKGATLEQGAILYKKTSGNDRPILMECTVNNNKLVKVTTKNHLYEYDMQRGLLKDDFLMCDFRFRPGGPSKGTGHFPSVAGDRLEINYYQDSTPIVMTAGEDLSAMNVKVVQRKSCTMSIMDFYRRTAEIDRPNHDIQMFDTRLNKDKEMTCSDGYQLIVSEPDGRLESYTSIKCDSLLSTMKNGGSTGARSGKMRVFCAQPDCRTCVDRSIKPLPKTPCDGPNNCVLNDYDEQHVDSCYKLTCPVGLANLAVTNANCTAIRDGNNIVTGGEWKYNKAAVKDFKCVEKTSCNPTVAFEQSSDQFKIVTEEEVRCNGSYELSYQSAAINKRVELSLLRCDQGKGKWLQVLKNSDKTTDQYEPDDNKLRCSKEGDDGVAPVAAASMMTYVIGGVAGLLVVVVAVIICVYCCCCKKKKREPGASKKHRLATKSSKSKETRSKESKSRNGSKSNVPSSSGVTGGGASSDHSVTQKNPKKDQDDGGQKDPTLMALDSEQGTATAVASQEKSAGMKTGMLDENRSNPTERSAIAKTDALNENEKKRKTALATAAMLESSKAQGDEGDDEGTEKGQSRLDTGLAKGSKTRNLDPTQAQTKNKNNRTKMNTAATQGGSQQDPTRGPDGTQQQSENNDEPGTGTTQKPTDGTQAATLLCGKALSKQQQQKKKLTRSTQGTNTQMGTPAPGAIEDGPDGEGEGEQQPEQLDAATAVSATDEAGLGTTQGVTRGRTRNTQATTRNTRDTQQATTATRLGTTMGDPDDPKQGEMKTGREKEEDDEGTNPLNTAVGKDKTKDRKTAQTAKENEDEDESVKKIKSRKKTIKPRDIELDEKEKKIKAGARRNRNDYPTMRDIESDWDSDKDKRDTPKKKKTIVDKAKKKSNKKEEKKPVKKEEKKEEKKDKKAAAAKPMKEFTAIDDGPGGFTVREQTAREGTHNLTPYDPTQATPTKTRARTKTHLTTAFDPTETVAVTAVTQGGDRTAFDRTHAPDRTQAGTTAPDRTQGGRTTMADGTQGATTIADFTQQAHTGADPTQAGTTYDPTQAQTTLADGTQAHTRTMGDRTTQGETRTRVLTGRSRTNTRTRGAEFTQAATTQGADFTQAHTTGQDPTQAQTSYDPTQANTTLADGTQAPTAFDETQNPSRDGTIGDPTQLPSVDTQDGRTRKSRTKAAFTARTATRPGTTQSRTKADFTQDPTRHADGTQGATTIADFTQVAHTGQDPTQNATTLEGGTQMPTRTRTRTARDPTQTATANDPTQAQTRGPHTTKERTQTQTRFDETQAPTSNDPTQAATTMEGGTQAPTKSRTKTPRSAATANEDFGPTQTATRAGRTQTQTAVDRTGTMTAVDPTRELTALTAKDRTRTKVDRTGTMTAVDHTGSATAVDPTHTMTAVDPTREMTAVTAKGRTRTKLDRTGTMTAVDGTGTVTAVDRTGTMTAVDRTGTQTAVDPTRDMTAVDPTRAASTAKENFLTQTQTAVDRTGTVTAVDRTRTGTLDRTRTKVDRTGTMTAVDRTGTMTAVDRTGTQTAVDRTGTQTAVDPTHTMTAVDPTRDMTAIDQTRGASTAKEDFLTQATTAAGERTQTATRAGRTQTQTAVDQTGAATTAADMTQTNLERTKSKTARDKTQTQTNADETQGAAATSAGPEQTQGQTRGQTTAKDRTQTATKGDRTQTATKGERTQTQTRDKTRASKTQTTAKDQTQMTGHETTQAGTSKDPTQTHNDQ